MKILKTDFSWLTVLLFQYNEEKMGFFLTKILFMNEI